MEETVTVALGRRAYGVKIGRGLLESLGAEARELSLGKASAVVSDTNVAALYGQRVMRSLEAAGFHPIAVTVPAGEKSKSMEKAEWICERMIEAGMDRKAWVLALGGGVVGDLAGFVAAIYYRGIALVQAPTTIVAQVDSAVGGKTGVNSRTGKNLIGAFLQPRLVVADVDTLATLPEREFNEGFAEVIKHGAIRDRTLLDAVASLDRANLAPILRRNVEIKAAIVAADEEERTGERALLNFGHTIGHGIEAAAGYGQLLHGEAISLGLVAACRLSVQKAGLEKAEADRVVELLKQFKLPVTLPAGISMDAIMAALKSDKKFEDGNIRFVLCPRLGEAFVSKDVTLEDVRGAVEALTGA